MRKEELEQFQALTAQGKATLNLALRECRASLKAYDTVISYIECFRGYDNDKSENRNRS